MQKNHANPAKTEKIDGSNNLLDDNAVFKHQNPFINTFEKFIKQNALFLYVGV